MKLAEAFVEVHADTGPLDRGLGQVRSKLESTMSTLKGVAASVIGTALVYKTVGFFGEAIKSAGDLTESLSKTEVVFGESAGSVKETAEQMAEQFGSARTEILDAASAIGLVGKASGLSKQAAADMGIRLAKLADDASSFYNVPLADALLAIRSGLVGEAEPMRRFGVLLSEAAVKTEAVRLGLAREGEELTEATKVRARYAIIVRQMADAEGDHARTQFSFNNQLREITGRIASLGQAVGQVLLPPLNAALSVLNPIVSAMEKGTRAAYEFAAGLVATAEASDDIAEARKLIPSGAATMPEAPPGGWALRPIDAQQAQFAKDAERRAKAQDVVSKEQEQRAVDRVIDQEREKARAVEEVKARNERAIRTEEVLDPERFKRMTYDQKIARGAEFEDTAARAKAFAGNLGSLALNTLGGLGDVRNKLLGAAVAGGVKAGILGPKQRSEFTDTEGAYEALRQGASTAEKDKAETVALRQSTDELKNAVQDLATQFKRGVTGLFGGR